MDAVTIVLIALGVVALLGFVVLAIREIARKGSSASKQTTRPVSTSPRENTTARTSSAARSSRVVERPTARPVATVPEPAQPEDESETESTAPRAEAPRAAAVAESPEIEADDAGSESKSAQPVAAFDGALQAIAARLSIMPADFDRSAAVAVGDCADSDLDAMIDAGLLEHDAATGRLSWVEAARESASRTLTPDEARTARLRHAEHFANAADEAPQTEGGPRGLDLPELVNESDDPHYDVAFDFLAGAPGLESQLLRLVDAHMRAGRLHRDPREGIRWHAAALAAARALNDRTAERDALNNLGGAYTDAAEHEHARECYEQATVINRELGDRLGEGRSLGNTGLACHRLGEIAKAVEWYETVLSIMREVGDRQREGLVLHSLGQAAADLKEYRKAIGYFEQHLKIVVEAGDRRGEAVVLGSIAAAHAALGDARAALELFERQFKLTEMIRDLPGEGAALGGMGRAHQVLGNPEKAVECFQHQVEVAELIGDAAAGVIALGELGLAHEAATRTSKALECFDRQLKIARKIGDQKGEAQALWNAARAVRSRGQIEDAITRASAALPLFVQAKSDEAEKVRAEIEQWRTQLK